MQFILPNEMRYFVYLLEDLPVWTGSSKETFTSILKWTDKGFEGIYNKAALQVSIWCEGLVVEARPVVTFIAGDARGYH